MFTVNPLIKAESQIQAGSLIEAGGSKFNSNVLIDAGSPIEAGISNVSWVLKPSEPPYDDAITDVIASAISG